MLKYKEVIYLLLNMDGDCMSEFRILTDDELKSIYEEAQKRTDTSFKFGSNRIREEQLKEEKRYTEAMKKYESDMAIFKKKYEEQHQQFLKSEETQKKFYEQMQDSKIKYWEDMKVAKERMGQTVDESTRPQRMPYPKKEFHYWGTVPQKPVKKDYTNNKPNSCSEILKSFQIYAKVLNSNNKRASTFQESMEMMYEMVEAMEASITGMGITSDFFRNELTKEKYVTEQNQNKLRYLTLREHFLNMMEEKCCTVSEAWSKDSNVNGLYGEKLTVFELELMKAKNYKGSILHDLYIPTADGKYSQIDVLFVCSKGIFVIESKNYSGTISGNEYDDKWHTRSVYDNKRYSSYSIRNNDGFYNPIKQNKKHIEAVQYHLKGIPCFSLIAFSERCKLSEIKVSSKTGYVFNRYAMINVFSRIFNSNPDVLNDDMINYVTNHLRQFCNADSNVKKAHNDNMRDNVTHDYNNFEYFDDYSDYKDNNY